MENEPKVMRVCISEVELDCIFSDVEGLVDDLEFVLKKYSSKANRPCSWTYSMQVRRKVGIKDSEIQDNMPTPPGDEVRRGPEEARTMQGMPSRRGGRRL